MYILHITDFPSVHCMLQTTRDIDSCSLLKMNMSFTSLFEDMYFVFYSWFQTCDLEYIHIKNKH